MILATLEQRKGGPVVEIALSYPRDIDYLSLFEHAFLYLRKFHFSLHAQSKAVSESSPSVHTCSYNFFHLNVREEWRTYVLSTDQKARPTRTGLSRRVDTYSQKAIT
jgi:hypothetical protein